MYAQGAAFGSANFGARNVQLVVPTPSDVGHREVAPAHGNDVVTHYHSSTSAARTIRIDSRWWDGGMTGAEAGAEIDNDEVDAIVFWVAEIVMSS